MGAVAQASSAARVVCYVTLSDNLYLGCDRIDSLLGGVFKLDFATGVDHSDNSTDQPSFHTYPNPFNSEVKMRIVLSERSSVLLEIFNVLGKLYGGPIPASWRQALIIGPVGDGQTDRRVLLPG